MHESLNSKTPDIMGSDVVLLKLRCETHSLMMISKFSRFACCPNTQAIEYDIDLRNDH